MDGAGSAEAEVVEDASDAGGAAMPGRSSLAVLGPGVAVYDAGDRLVLANRRLKDMFPGLAPHLKAGASFHDLCVEVARLGYFGHDPENIAQSRRALRTSDGPVEVSLTDGRRMLLEDSATDDGGHVITYTDITAHHTSHEALAAREERLNLALRASTDGLWDWDVASGSVYYSPRWKEILGYADHELENLWDTWRIMVHPDDLPLVEARTAAAVEGGPDSYETTFRMRHRAGGWRRILSRVHVSRGADGRATRLVGVHSDITALHDARDLAARTAQRLAEAEQLAAVGSWERDRDGAEHWSPGLRKLLGSPDGTPASRETLLASIHPEDRARAAAALDNGRCTFRLLCPDGRERQIAAAGRVETDASGTVVRAIGALLDVTLLRTIEDRAARAEVHMLAAIETVQDGLVLLDPRKRIVMLNSQYSDDFPTLQDHLVPGAHFADFLRAMREQGLVRLFDGIPGDQDWLTPRLASVGRRQAPFEMELSDGRWFLIRESRTADDYLLIVRTDITDLKRREAALAESEERFRTMIDNSVQFVAVLDTAGTLLDVNATALRFVGARKEDLLGQAFWRTPWWVDDPTSQTRLRNAIRRAAAGEQVRFEALHSGPEGDIHTVDVSITPVRDASGKVTLLIPEGRDITAQREAEDALHDNTRFVQALADTAQTPIYAHDRQGRYVFCNDAFALAVARPPSQIIGKSVFHTALRETGVNMQEVNRDLMAAGGSVSYETRVTLGDGTLRDMIVAKATYAGADGRVDGIVAVLADITRQKEAERRFTDFARSSADWFWEMDRRGRFTYVSDRIGDTTAFRASDVVGRHRDDFIDSTWRPDALAEYRQALEERRPIRDFVYRTAPLRGGVVHYIRINAVPAYDAEGTFIGFRGTGSEVTAQTEAEDALHEAKRVAELASRAKTEFLAAMSHELRTPLNAIIGFSEIMHMQALGPIGGETYLEYAADIKKSGEHLLSLVNDVLDASRLETGRLKLHEAEVDLTRLAAAAAQLTRQRADDAGVAVTTEVRGRLPAYRADEGRLKQVLTSLLSNGVKFSPHGGVVRLTVERDDADGPLRIVVADTGIGMSREDIERALQRFTQVDSSLNRRYEGMGLGLTLARDIVALHGGTLDIDATPGAGTRVTVLLPADRFCTEAAPPA